MIKIVDDLVVSGIDGCKIYWILDKDEPRRYVTINKAVRKKGEVFDLLLIKECKKDECGAPEPIEPFLELNNMFLARTSFFQEFVDECARIGIFPGKTNKDKIKAEAVSDERREQIDYLRGLTEKVIFTK